VSGAITKTTAFSGKVTTAVETAEHAAWTAKAQAHEAVSAAEQAARRIDELSRAPVDEATRPH